MPDEPEIIEKHLIYGQVLGPYLQTSVKKRIEALFLDNIGKILTREQILEVARDPFTQAEPENWHQRLSELRTDSGYTILTSRDRSDLKVQEYLMPDTSRRENAGARVRPTPNAWQAVLKRANYSCEWNEGGMTCRLKQNEIDPIGGGTVKLTPDHKSPHSINPDSDPNNPDSWLALCGRHQVMKKNYWDNITGKLNTYAIMQAATKAEKKEIFLFLLHYYGYKLREDGVITQKQGT